LRKSPLYALWPDCRSSGGGAGGCTKARGGWLGTIERRRKWCCDRYSRPETKKMTAQAIRW
jgi:hypothetical protein